MTKETAKRNKELRAVLIIIGIFFGIALIIALGLHIYKWTNSLGEVYKGLDEVNKDKIDSVKASYSANGVALSDADITLETINGNEIDTENIDEEESIIQGANGIYYRVVITNTDKTKQYNSKTTKIKKELFKDSGYDDDDIKTDDKGNVYVDKVKDKEDPLANPTYSNILKNINTQLRQIKAYVERSLSEDNAPFNAVFEKLLEDISEGNFTEEFDNVEGLTNEDAIKYVCASLFDSVIGKPDSKETFDAYYVECNDGMEANTFRNILINKIYEDTFNKIVNVQKVNDKVFKVNGVDMPAYALITVNKGVKFYVNASFDILDSVKE